MKQMLTPNSRDIYVKGVLARARHHAPNVMAVVPALLGFVEYYGERIQASERKNGLHRFGNLSWFKSKATGRKYAFRYEHNPSSIELRRHDSQGPLVYRFDNSTPNDEIKRVFEN